VPFQDSFYTFYHNHKPRFSHSCWQRPMPRDRPKLCYRSSRDEKGDLEPNSPVQDRLDVSYPDFEGLERNGRTRTCLWHSSAMSPPCSSTTDTFDCSNSIASIWCRRQWKRQKGRLTRLLSRSQRTHFYCWIEIVTSWSHRCKGHPSTISSVANCMYYEFQCYGKFAELFAWDHKIVTFMK